MQQSHGRTRQLATLRAIVFGVDPKSERKTVPAYDAAMVKRLPAGVAYGVRQAKRAGYDRSNSLLPDVAPRGAAWL